MKKKIELSINKLIILIVSIGIFSGTISYVTAGTVIDSEKVSYKDNSGLGVTNVQAAIDGTCIKFNTQLTNLKQEIIDEMYPKGSIYITTELSTADAVAEKLGGTWVAYGQGRTLVGVGSNGTTTYAANSSGGKSTATLSTTNLPTHTHVIPSLSGTTSTTGDHAHTLPLSGLGTTILSRQYNSMWVDNYAGEYNSLNYTSTGGDHYHSLTTSASTTTTCNNCSGSSFSIQNPYVTVYMYQRVSI